MIPILWRILLSLIVPPSVVLAIYWYIPLGVQVQPWILVLVTFMSIPLTFTVRVQLDLFLQRQEAASMGAVMIPEWKSRFPGGFPLVRIMVDELNNRYIAEHQTQHCAEIGHHTFSYRLLWDTSIMTSEPEYIKAILATEFSNYEKGDKFREFMDSVLGVGVFNSDGDLWKFHRALTRPFFSMDRISHFDIFDKHAEDSINKMKARFLTGHPIDFQDLVSRFTLDSATEFLLGHCVNSLSASLPYPHNVVSPANDLGSNSAAEFVSAFAHALHVVAKRTRLGSLWALNELFGDESKASMKVVHAYLDPILKEAVRKAKDSPPDSKLDEVDEDATLLDHLVKHTLDPVVLHDEVLNILLAGRDTTTSTLTFAIYLLATNPGVLNRLREEILKRVGPTRRPTYDDIREMKYLRAVLNETLRLFPAVPINVRTPNKSCTFPPLKPNGKPLYVSAGFTVTYSVFMMHRRKDLWGPDAEEFDPDRFIDDRLKKYLLSNPMIFLPFNAGPRICLGQQFAYNEMSFFMIRLLQSFDCINLELEAQPPEFRTPESWRNKPGRQRYEKCWPKQHLTIYAAGGMWVTMREATDDDE